MVTLRHNADYPNSRWFALAETQLNSEIKEATLSCIPASAPNQMVSTMSLSGKPSYSLPPEESNYLLATTTSPLLDDSVEI